MNLSPCARCPKLLGTSCCETKGDERLALLTSADIARVRDAVRRRPEAFVEEEWVDEGEAQAFEARRPLYRGYFRHGPLRRTLRRRDDGACVFLDRERGCALDDQTRPVACRLYPFDLLADGRWSVLVSRHGSVEAAAASGQGCLAVEEAAGMGTLLGAFGLTRRTVEALGETLRREVQAG